LSIGICAFLAMKMDQSRHTWSAAPDPIPRQSRDLNEAGIRQR
jgi:hypothetical protein